MSINWTDSVRTDNSLRLITHADNTTEQVHITDVTGNKTTTGTPINATNMNKQQSDLTTYHYRQAISTAITAGTAFTIPCNYKVGNNVLDVYLYNSYGGEKLLLSSDNAGTDGSYVEVGTTGTTSNQIKTTTDWSLASGDILEFYVRGEYI